MSKISEEKDGGWLIHKAGRGWYRPNAEGYTNDTEQAGRHSHADARSHSHPNGWDGPRDGITIKHESELRSGGEEKNGVGDADENNAGKWRENVEHLLSTGDPDVIRCHEGGGPESLIGSLVLTMMRTRNARDKAITNTDLSLRAENERLRKERDAALDNDWVVAPAYAAKVEACRKYRDRATTAEAKLEEAAKVLEPFANAPDDWTVESVNAARSFLANLKGAK